MSDNAVRLPLLGGALCLDFTNTLEPWGTEQPTEFLTSYAGLLAWVLHASALTSDRAAALSTLAEAQPAAASAVLDQARALRRAIHRLFSAAAQGRSPGQDEMERLNGVLAEAGCHGRLEHSGDGYPWGWQGVESDLRAVLWPIALSVADILASPQLVRVKVCAGCGWLFLDGDTDDRRLPTAAGGEPADAAGEPGHVAGFGAPGERVSGVDRWADGECDWPVCPWPDA